MHDSPNSCILLKRASSAPTCATWASRTSPPSLSRRWVGSSGPMRESSVWARAATSSGSRSARRRCSTRRTGLANRTLLRDRLRQTLASSERSGRGVALLYVDVDRFADLNHLLGHAGADNVLQAVATRLQPIVREADTIARWGADEFVVVLQDMQGSDGARRVATEVHAALADPWHVRGHSFNVTASVGIALFPGDGGDADTLLEHVMIAAQEAKDRGGDTDQFYDHVMGSEVAQRIEIEHELRLALQREELELFYQPEIDLATEAM